MVDIVEQLCIKSVHIVDGEKEITLEQGKWYTTSLPKDDGTITVFTEFWCHGVEQEYFVKAEE